MIRRAFLLAFSSVLVATVSLAPAPAAAMTAPCTLATFAALNLPETTIMLVESLQRARTRRPSATSPCPSVG